jgi:hypothetical protein
MVVWMQTLVSDPERNVSQKETQYGQESMCGGEDRYGN